MLANQGGRMLRIPSKVALAGLNATAVYSFPCSAHVLPKTWTCLVAFLSKVTKGRPAWVCRAAMAVTAIACNAVTLSNAAADNAAATS